MLHAIDGPKSTEDKENKHVNGTKAVWEDVQQPKQDNLLPNVGASSATWAYS